jgi:hypothetical protein
MNTPEEVGMEALVCASVSVYGHALSRGSTYEVLATDLHRRQIRVTGDDGRARWFPSHCFAHPEQPLPVMMEFTIEDHLPREGPSTPVEVTIRFVSGERRWCVFATPQALVECGDWIDGTRLRFHARNRHVILAEEITEDLIGRMLRYLDAQGELVECTLPLFETNGEGERA